MYKCLVVNIFLLLLLGVVFIFVLVYVVEKIVVNILKVDGMLWFNWMGEGVVQVGKEFNFNVFQVGLFSIDVLQQVKIIEDLIVCKVDVIIIVFNDVNVLELVFKKVCDVGIVVLINELFGQLSVNWDVEIIDNEKFVVEYVEYMVKWMGGKGGYVIYVGSFMVLQYNLWVDLLVKY